MRKFKEGFNYIIRVEGPFEKHIYTDKLDADLAYRDYMAAGWFMINDMTYARRIEDVSKPVSPAPKRLERSQTDALLLPRYHNGSGFAQ